MTHFYTYTGSNGECYVAKLPAEQRLTADKFAQMKHIVEKVIAKVPQPRADLGFPIFLLRRWGLFDETDSRPDYMRLTMDIVEQYDPEVLDNSGSDVASAKPEQQAPPPFERSPSESPPLPKKATVTKQLEPLRKEGRFSCPVCEKVYRKISHCRDHIRSHTGERPFSCTDCDQTFYRSDTRTRHMRIHGDKRPYSCAHCGGCFRRVDHVRAHILIHVPSHQREQAFRQIRLDNKVASLSPAFLGFK